MESNSSPSPELKALIKSWTQLQKEKYGENWKEILAKEMSTKMLANPFMEQLIKKLGEKK